MAFDGIEQVQPMPEYAYDVGQDLNGDQRGGLQPRLFKQHTPLSRSRGRFCADVNGYGDCKYIVSVRDPATSLVSWFNFQQQKGENSETSQRLGERSTRCENADEMLERHGWPIISGNTLWKTYLEFWLCRHQPNVLLVVYEDMLSHPEVSVKRIAEFMGISADEERIARVLERTTKAFMLEHASRFDESWLRAQQIEYNRTSVLVNPAVRVTKGATARELKHETIDRVNSQWRTDITSATGLQTYEEMIGQWRQETNADFSTSL